VNLRVWARLSIVRDLMEEESIRIPHKFLGGTATANVFPSLDIFKAIRAKNNTSIFHYGMRAC
jgi:hypothetical protein